MDLAICITVKNRSNLVVNQEDFIETYKHVMNKLEITPARQHFPPTLNRDNTITLNLLPKMLISLVSVKNPEDKWTVIIIDYDSTDANVELISSQILQGHMDLVVHKELTEQFSRGSGLHLAANLAKQRNIENMFFCDADMYFTNHEIFDQAKAALDNGKIYFPICFSFVKPDHLYGFWRDTGYGMLFIKTEMYFELPSDQIENGEIKSNFPQNRIIRSKADGYFHQWHPKSG
jgi:hypothetical protein